MGVTIDNLQIEIQSSSTNAAQGIDALATSLEKLKKNGAFKTVTTNLNHLSGALNGLPNVHKASNSLRTLANSIEKLKEVGTVSSLTNSLKKLPAALQSIANMDLEKVAPQIQKIADVVAPLSAIKAGGFGSMVNGMKNLGKVTASLDDETIAKFAEKVDLLNQKLGPLSDKMTTIKAGFNAINSNARKAASGVEKLDDEINASALNWSSFIEIIRTAVGAIQNMVQQFSNLIAQAIEWDGISARFGRGFAGQASETYAWIQRLNDEMGINIQEFMQYSSVYSTMLTGFGVAAEDAGKMALGYMELTYDIWAGYNDVYGSLAETAEAVKSAIAGEVEPVRRAGFTIVEATLEQTAANHGLKISLENATEAQKSYLRYLTLVDQAHAQGLVGTYAKELNTAEGLMRTLSQQLKSLTQAFGSLFLPILVKVIPYVQAFVELLTEGVHALAALFGITIQGVDWSDYNSGAGDAIESTEGVAGALDDAAKAAKELKNATLGIDELNVISPSSATSGSGGAGSGSGGTGFEDLDIDSLWDESIFKDINSQVDELKEKLKSWLPIISAIGAGIGAWGMLSLIESAGEAMVKLSQMEGKIGTLKKALAGLAILTIEAVLVFTLADEYLETGNLMNLVGEALATAAGGYLMYKGFGSKGLVMSLAVSMAAQLAAITLNLADGGVDFDDPELWIQSAFTTALGGVAGGFLAYKGMIPVSTGKGVGLGLLAGLSLTLAAITIGEVTANGELTKESILTAVGTAISAAGFGFVLGGAHGAMLGATMGVAVVLAGVTISEITANGEVTKESVFTGIGSVLAAAGFGFTIGGVHGALIGAAVGLAVNIVGAIVGTVSKEASNSLEKDLKSRFGNITLDNESLEVFIDKVTAVPREVTIDGTSVPVTVALDMYVAQSQVLKDLEDKVYGTLEKLDTYNIKIAVGVNVDYDEYMASVDALMKGAQEYLEQHYLTTSIAISILESDSSEGLSQTLTSFYATNSEKLAELGSQLKDAVSDAFVDGEWIPNKLQEALELQKEIQGILDYVSEIEYKAKLQNLQLSVSGTDLTKESFNDVLNGAKEAIEERLNALEEVKMSQLQVAIMEYDANIAEGMSEAEAKKIYDDTVADIQEAYEQGKLELNYGTVSFGIETIQKAFSEEIERAEAEGWFNYTEKLQITLDDVALVVDVEDFGNGEIYTDIKTMINSIGTLYEQETAGLSKSTRKSIKKLLKELEPTMEDYEEIAAANRKAGTTVTANLRDGLNDYNELNALRGDTDSINYMIGQQLSTDTTFLNTLATAKKAGKQIDDNVAEGLLNNIDYVTDEATGVVTGIKNSITGEVIAVTPTMVENFEQLGVNLTTGLNNGAESEMKKSKKKWYEWAIWPWNWFKEKNEIHSPSKLFERGGNYIVEGLVKGISISALRDRFSTMWTNAKTWWDNKKGNLKAYTPSIGSIYEKLADRWNSAREWWNNKKSSMKSYTPSIGSIYEKVYDRWKNARDWWNSKKGSFKTYTPSIGSIKDKIVSAWNTAKKWWSSNAKLSTKLNVSVPKIKVQWDTASAFGKSFKYPTGFKLDFAANGGIFDQGSMIWAGERGAEIVANAAGGKTGVMNVQQMQEAVYEGVYAAVSAAMRGHSSGGGSVNVYLDGKQITAAVEQRQHERGATIMGNEVYSY